jgi:hypothetical protein
MLSFLDESRHFLFQVAPRYPDEAEWTPFQTFYFFGNLASPGYELGTSGSVAKNSDH